MKLRDLFAIFTLSVMVKGTLWAAAVQPIILGFGAVLTAINSDVLDIQLSEGEKSWQPFFMKRNRSG